jgi:hypothetical protein
MNGEKNYKKRIKKEKRREVRLTRFDQNLLASTRNAFQAFASLKIDDLHEAQRLFVLCVCPPNGFKQKQQCNNTNRPKLLHRGSLPTQFIRRIIFFLYLLLHGITKLRFTSHHNTPRRVRCVRVYPTLGRKPACPPCAHPPQSNQTGQKQIQRPSPTRPVSLLVDKPG